VRQMRGDGDAALDDLAQALRLDPRALVAGWQDEWIDEARARKTQVFADYIEGVRSPRTKLAVDKAVAPRRRTQAPTIAEPPPANRPRPSGTLQRPRPPKAPDPPVSVESPVADETPDEFLGRLLAEPIALPSAEA